MNSTNTTLIAYDGSEEARRALTWAAQLLKTDHVDILTVWEPAARQAARTAGMSGMHQGDWTHSTDGGDPAFEIARDVARDGQALAEELGLSARAHIVETASSVWSAILDAAEQLQPTCLVTGTKAISGVSSWWRTSTADSLVKNAGIPILVVPPEDDED